MASNVCWGIEVGAGGIKALKLEAGADGPRVLDFAVIQHKKVLSTPGLDQNDAIRVALGELVAQYDLGKASIVMSVPGHQAFARFAKLPPVPPKQVPDIVKYEAVQQIPFPIDQVEWDYQTFKSDDSPDIEVGIFAITRERVMEKLTLYEDVDIVPDVITLSPAGLYNALAYDLEFSDQTPGTILLDIGTTSTDLVIADGARVWIRTFPIGGHHFTEALVNAFQLTYPKAEKLKREAESSKHARHVFQAMRPVFSDLAQDVQRSIGYYQSLHREAKLVRLIGVGSTFRLPGLRKFLKQQLQLDVYRLEQFKRISMEGPRAGEFQAETLNLATAYGLALQGLDMAALEANLMPKAVSRGAMWKRKIKWFGAAAGVAAAAGAVMFYRPFQDSVEVANNPVPREVSAVISQVGQLKSEAAEVTGAASADPQVEQLLGLLDKRDVVPHLLNDLSLMVADAQAKADRLPPPAVGPKPTGPALTLKGLKADFVPLGEGETPAAGAADGSTPPIGPKFQVEATFTTTQPDAQKFIISSVETWLRQNARRAGSPFEFVVASNPWTITGVQEVAESGELRAATGGGAPSPAPMIVGGGRGGGAPATGGGRAGRGGVSGDLPNELLPLGGTPPGVVGGDAGGAPSWSGGQGVGRAGEPGGAAPGLEDLRRLAPLPPEPALPAGTRVTTFTVRWEAVLAPKPVAEQNGEAKP